MEENEGLEQLARTVERRLDSIEQKAAVTMATVQRTELVVKETNGRLNKLERDQSFQAGRTEMLRWMMAVGIAVAGLMLTGVGVLVTIIVAGGA